MAAADLEETRAVALSYLDASWAVLEEQHVLPRPFHQPQMKVGKDWYGPDIQDLPELAVLEAALTATFPDRLSGILGQNHWEFGSAYAYRMLERSAVYATSIPRTEAQMQAVDEALAFLAQPTNEYVTQRIVSHLEVNDVVHLESMGIEISPLPADLGWIDLEDALEVADLQNRNAFIYSEHRHSVVTVRTDHQPQKNWADTHRDLSGQLDEALTILRLFRRTSMRSVIQVSGFRLAGSFLAPEIDRWSNDFVSDAALSEAEHTCRIELGDIPRLQAFAALLDAALQRAEAHWAEKKLVVSSIGLGLAQFNQSFSSENWLTQIPRLVTALEGWMLPEPATEAIVFRLQNRLCLLLQDGGPEVLHEQVRLLYALRSSVQHAGEVKMRRLRKVFREVAGTDGAAGGVDERASVETLREIVRKAICARIVLTADEVLWPIEDDEPIDLRLYNETYRERARACLKSASDDFGLGLFA